MPDLWKDGDITLAFWEWGPGYTIVAGKHIGTDVAPDPRGETWDVPALVAATVYDSVQSEFIGRIQVTDTGRAQRRFISYCHGFYGDPARIGTALAVGARTMRLAAGDERPGSLWGGEHCHVVVHDHPAGAYSRVGDTYYDPAVEIAAYRAGLAGGGASPFNPEEWDDMATRDELKSAFREVLAEQARLGQYSLVPMEDGKIYLVNNENQKRVHVQTPYHVQLIIRRLSNQGNDTMLAAENDIVDGYIRAVE